jgi:hypothetical protein
MPQDRISDLKKKRQREKEMDAIESSVSSKDEAPYKAARERLAKQQVAPLGQARMASPEGFSRLSSQSANYVQPLYKRLDTPLAPTPEPQIR